MSVLVVLALLGCTKGSPDGRDQSPVLGVDETESRLLPGLHAPAYVVRTEGNIPHVYAGDDVDLARVHGFTVARDRFFEMDMSRRLAEGRVAALLGDKALSADESSRAQGMGYVADLIEANLTDAQAEQFDAFADGINAYIDAVAAGDLPGPTEYETAKVLFGKTSSADLMARFDRHDVAAMAATIVYNLGYETGDVGNEQTIAALQTYGLGQPLETLRHDGAWTDIWAHIEPVFPLASAHGWGLETADGGGGGGQPGGDRARRPPIPRMPSAKALPSEMYDRLEARLKRIEKREGHDHEVEFGSNAWAVEGTSSTDGRSLLAGDGHLPLSVPSLFWQIGLDTRELGGGDTHETGMVIPGMTVMAVGTNGDVAWSQTQLMGDITDWYREQLQLDASGKPAATLFQGDWKPVVEVPETYEVADVPILGSTGRTETWSRFTTFDGRWIADIEGRTASGPDEVLNPGETLLNLGGDWVVPGDTDGDGVITAVSFDYTGLDDADVLLAVDGFGHSSTVEAYREAQRGLVAYSQNMVAADSTGSIYYSGYQQVPCRDDLPRQDDGEWQDGADPSRLLDGTTYGGFDINTGCVVPFDVYPGALDPAQGYVFTANNDIGDISLDGSLTNDPYYVGGPWLEGYRAEEISSRLASAVSAGTASLDEMQSIQADHHSLLGEQFVPVLTAAIDHARTLAETEYEPGSSDERLAQAYAANAAMYDEVEERLQAWSAAGFDTPSGVQTFYQPAGEDPDDAVATTIFTTWFGRYQQRVLDDEGLPDVFRPSGATGRTRTLLRLLRGRGADNPEGLASWNPETGESAFFDVLGTSEIETSDEDALWAVQDAVTFLSGPPGDPGRGGYGTSDMSQWTWGLKHWVHFDSVLAEFLGNDPTFSFLVEKFSITPDQIPLADDIASGDPRQGMTGFPRPGDNLNVDAANAGFDGYDFTYGSGPVFRMAIALGPDGAEGRNILPGGQSGLTDSPFYADQASLWLGNETWPMRITADDVAQNAIGRESFWPEDALP